MLLVAVNAAIIIAVIAVFCVKLVNRRDASWRVQLSTLFLPFIPLAIYLSLFCRVLELVQRESGEKWRAEFWPLIPLFVIFVVITTAILLVFGEAVVGVRCKSFAEFPVLKARTNKKSWPVTSETDLAERFASTA
jgi:hypothetical protein